MTFHEMTTNREVQRKVVQQFHDLYYSKKLSGWQNTYWLGTPVRKTPCDLWMLQEILWKTRPDIIIETGTFYGGSALFTANILDAIGKGRIISIDIENLDPPAHKRITYLLGSSTDEVIVSSVKSAISTEDTVLVDLDSDHSKNHVLSELTSYAPLVTPGSYLIVEDTNTTGPREALREFLSNNSDFIVDEKCEKFLLTFYPGGWLKRI